MIPLYLGFDQREEVGYHTFCSSVIHRASEPVSFVPLHLSMLKKLYRGEVRDGSNAFTYSRFLIPYMQEFRGMAIFADGSDMICTEDIAQLWALRNPFLAVQCVQHRYATIYPRKYVGTLMESDNRDYPRKNWSSLMIINCAHYAWRYLTPDKVESMEGADLHQFNFIPERYIGELPAEWNWLCQEYGENPSAKLIHYSAGIPAFHRYADTESAGEWFSAVSKVNHATS